MKIPPSYSISLTEWLLSELTLSVPNGNTGGDSEAVNDATIQRAQKISYSYCRVTVYCNGVKAYDVRRVTLR